MCSYLFTHLPRLGSGQLVVVIKAFQIRVANREVEEVIC